ncbi:TIGR03085 family metal-binding protein [Actinokineospora fastidiosa]|uniref:TIGR03085 family protein n=1 Tax=Actinokineospora fastidiosa TaxID=1816 RepID=A0A918LEK7_9PSEU|nr:TIGR03085 family metal-binding protein [Actinokineospora fastidiosa]GGS38865.1 TIGR03085 family protein [Actinokineospora fastidiosa]
MSVAKDERARLCDLLAEVGPDQPTLCAGWTTRDLAAHLVVRERRMDAAPGILVKPLAPYLDRVQAKVAAKPWNELLRLIRTGPPVYSPHYLLDDLVNTPEFFIHHEDVRRAQPQWSPRPADPRRDRALWTAVRRAGRLMFRNSPVGVALRTPDGREVAVKRGPNTVTVLGEPGELLLFAFGRDQAEVGFEGEQAAIGALRGLARGL